MSNTQTARKYHAIVGIAVFLLPGVASAQEVRKQPSAVDTAIERGLTFLTKDALDWKAKNNCVSCHHGALVIWSMREAKERGYTVNEPVLAELMKWLAESGEGKTGVARPPGLPKALNTAAVWFALALSSDPNPDAVSQKGLKKFWNTVKSDQIENGSWNSWPNSRPPIIGNSDDSFTALATLVLTSAAAAGDEEAKVARDKAVKWLAETKIDDEFQSLAIRLVLWKRLGKAAQEWEPLVKRIKEQQNADGGWSQNKEMASDAWATGQALYALSIAGIKPNDAGIARGRAFLVKTQREDGSWAMTSRPTAPGGEGSTGHAITGAGSAWAVIGLARSQ